MEGKGEIFVDEAHESGLDVLLFQIGQHSLMELLAVAALKITELNDGEWGTGAAKAWLSREKQLSGELWWDALFLFRVFSRQWRCVVGLHQQSASCSDAKAKGQECC